MPKSYKIYTLILFLFAFLFAAEMFPVFATHVSPSTDQNAYQFFNDNGTESGATTRASINTAITGVTTSEIVRIRFEVEEINGADAVVNGELQFSSDATSCTDGNWTTLDTSSTAWRVTASTQETNATATTNRISGSGLTFDNGFWYDTQNQDATGQTLNNEHTEWEWSISGPGAAGNTTYRFRVTDAGTALNTYTNCGQLTTATQATFDQEHFWFRDDDGSESAATGYDTGNLAVDANVAAANTFAVGQAFRLRMGLLKNNAGTDALTTTPKLQFKAGGTTGSCTTDTWTDVPTQTSCGSTAFCQATSGNFADGASTTRQLDATHTLIGGDMIETDGSANSATFGTGSNTDHAEWEWMLDSNSAAGSTIYTFRLVTSAGSAYTNYTKCPTLETDAVTLTYDQKNFRIRSDDTQTLNADAGWAGILNANASIGPDLEFRIRFEVEASTTGTEGFELWYSRDGAAYAIVPDNNGPINIHNRAAADDGQKTVQAIVSSQYVDLDATTDILSGSSATFVASDGSEDNEVPAVSFSGNSHTEIEFTVLMRKLYDSKGHNPDGTTFAFRLRKSDGTVLDTYSQTPTVTVGNRVGHIGGSVTETPMSYHVVDANGNLYYLGEYADTSNTAVMMKSTDGGDSWNPVDVSGEPTDNDLEAGDMDLRNNIINISMQGPSADDVFYWRFNTSAHATPDDWSLNETVTTSVTPEQQCSAIAERSSTTVIAYCGTPVGADQKVYYKIRNGTWGAENNLDATSGVDVQGVGARRDSTDKIHFVYTGYDGTSYKIYLRTLSTSDSLGTIRTITDTGITTQALGSRVSHTVPKTWTDGTTEKVGVAYRKTGNKLYYRSWNADTEAFDTEQQISDNNVEWSEGGNNIVLASIAVDDATDKIHAIYSEQTNYDIWYDNRPTSASSWGTDTELQDAVQASWIRSRLFTHSSGNGGNKVIGYIWDNSDPSLSPTQPGGTGFTRYDEKILQTFTQNDFEWFIDQSSVTLTDPWPSGSVDLTENEVFTQLPASRVPLVSGDKIRIQMNAAVGGVNLGAAGEDFKLQYAASEDCTTATGWADVGAIASGTIWRFFDNTSLTDGTTEVNQIATSEVAADYVESGPTQTNPNSVNAGQDMEWDFAVENNGAAENTTYCFRMIVNETGVLVFDAYNSDGYPKLTTAPGTSALMRHGNFFQNDIERGFFWAD